MKALVYKGNGGYALEEKPVPEVEEPTDIIVKLVYSTICGTDTHILKGDLPTCKPGRTLGHEGVGVVHDTGAAVARFKKDDRVLINCISSCAVCSYCRRGIPSHCEKGGWMLGHLVDGTQAEYVRIPLGDSGLHHVPEGADEKALVMLSDILPTGNECATLNGKVQPGCSMAIVGVGPVGLAALMTAQMYSPVLMIAIDKDEFRLEKAKKLGAHHGLNPDKVNVEEEVKKLTDGVGCDTVVEAVGYPETFEMCQDLVAVGGTIANVGVHGKSCTLKIEKLWVHNISITTRLVDTVTTPMLLRQFSAGKTRAGELITHEYPFAQMETAYGTFQAADQHSALKMLIAM